MELCSTPRAATTDLDGAVGLTEFIEVCVHAQLLRGTTGRLDAP